MADYMPPAAPTNLRQFEERIIAVICRWDVPEPDKTLQVQLQLLYGDDLLYDEVRDGELRERTFPVPMASTNYLLRVRAGNPGGWSAWAEATVHTEVFPLIDSRLGVMGTTYLEDVLHTDTWDGGTDAAGFGDPQRIDLDIGFSLSAIYNDPYVADMESVEVGVSTGVGDILSRMLRKNYDHDPLQEVEVMAASESGDISSRSVRINHDVGMDAEVAASASASAGDIGSLLVVFRYTDPDNDVYVTSSATAGDIASSIS